MTINQDGRRAAGACLSSSGSIRGGSLPASSLTWSSRTMKLYPIALKTERGEIARSFISEGIRQRAQVLGAAESYRRIILEFTDRKGTRGMKGVKHKFEWHCGELPDGWQGLPNNPGLIGLFCFEYDRDYSYPLAVFLHKEFFDAVEVEAGHIRIFWKNVTAAARQAVDELPEGERAGWREFLDTFFTAD